MPDRDGSDVALKLIHTADWHLGRGFPTMGEHETRLTRARLEVVGRILDLAEQRAVDAVLCAGDLFDDMAPGEEWWRGLLDEFGRRSWTRPVFLCPGNHDPLTERSVYDPGHAFRRGLPNYVHVVDRDDYVFDLGERAVLYGVPCRSRSGQTKLVEHIPKREPTDDRIRIGLLHGQTFDIKEHQTTFPIPKGAAEDRGLDYLAIGDTHGFREVEPDARAPTVYPSAPEPTNFGEHDVGYVAAVFFPRDRRRRPIVEREPVAQWTWREQTCRSLAELRALRADDGLKKCVMRLKVEMQLPLVEYDEARKLLRQLGGSSAASPRIGVLLEDSEGLQMEVGSPDDFPDDLSDVLQAAVDRLHAKAQSGDPTEAEVAKYAIHHLYTLVREGRL